MKTPRRILIVKMSSIGDVLLTTPVARAVREAYPQAHIAWAVDERCAAVVEGNPYLDSLIRIRCQHGEARRLLSCWKDVRALPPFDLTLDLHGLARSALVTWASRAPERVGFAQSRELSTFSYTRRLDVPSPGVHRVDFYCAFAEGLGIPAPHRDMFLPVTPEHEAQARELVQEQIPGAGPLVLFSLTAGRRQKCWPTECFGELADALIARHGCRVAVVGAPADRDAMVAMRAAMRREPVDLVGRFGLKTLAALLRRADLFVSADTGPMHIAAAMKTPVVALFGPTDPALYGPYRTECAILRKHCRCTPRWRRPKCQDRECMRAISPQEVEGAVLALLARTSSPLHRG